MMFFPQSFLYNCYSVTSFPDWSTWQSADFMSTYVLLDFEYIKLSSGSMTIFAELLKCGSNFIQGLPIKVTEV